MNDIYHDISRIYTLIRPPSPEDPFLHPIKHSKVIQQLMGNNEACHTLNSAGEIDIYLIMPMEADFDEQCQVVEEFSLVSCKKGKIRIEISSVCDEKTFSLVFSLDDPLEYHAIQYLYMNKRVNIYYINRFDEEYMCYGMKTVYLSDVLCYDLKRCLEGKTPLIMPRFCDNMISGDVINERMLTMKAWAFYIDFTSLQKKVRIVEDADELISLHIYNGMAKMQKAHIHLKNINVMILWIGRKIISFDNQEPREYYCVYLSGELFSGNKGMDQGANIMETALKELTEYIGSDWVTPLEEEAIPLAMITDTKIFRLNLTQDFFSRGNKIFAERFKTGEGYESYYQKIFNAHKASSFAGKVCDLAAKRVEKKTQKKSINIMDLKALIKSGREKDLPLIFYELNRIKSGDTDDVFITICEHFRDKAEPFLIPLTASPKYHIKAAAILSLGIIESKKAIPLLVEKLTGKKGEATLAKDALAIIGEKAVEQIIPLLQHNKPEIRIRAIDTLSLIGSDQAITAINNMGFDRSRRVEEAKKRVIHLLTGN